MHLGPFGVWWSGSWDVEGQTGVSAAAELEALGYGAIWSSGGFKPGLSSRFGRLLGATTTVVVASGVVNIWRAQAEELASSVAELGSAHPDRFLLGLGVSHGPLIEEYVRPYDRMVAYLDALDRAEPPVSADSQVLAALGPRMLELAARRTAGAHPYFVPVEHTALARQLMGPGPLLAPEMTVMLEDDPRRARDTARAFTAGYLALPNYANNLRRLGYGEEDLSGGGSDRLVDTVVAWGDADAVAARARAHRDAGADHVCLQVIGGGTGFPLQAYRELASILITDGSGRRPDGPSQKASETEDGNA